MHGRTIALAGALLSLALTAATANADETLTTAQPASRDGVVTSLTVSASQSAFRLRSVQATGGGGTAVTATSGPLLAAAGQRIQVTLPIAQGGTLELVGVTGSPALSATVEPDADGDGYGDTTQDACPTAYTTIVSQGRTCAQMGTVTVGPPLTLAPDPRGFSGGGNPMQALQGTSEVLAPPAGGIVTSFRLRADPAAGDTVLQVLRPNSDRTSYSVVAETQPVHVTDADVVTVPATIPVRQHDTLAARSVTGDLGVVAYVDGPFLETQQPPATLANHQSFRPGTQYADRRLLVQADVETDRDGDGKGDATQDRADLLLSATGPGSVAAGGTVDQTLTVRNAGPDAAVGVTLSFGTNGSWPGALPAGVTCGSGSAYNEMPGSCTIDRLDPGASFAVTLSTPASVAVGSVVISTGARVDAVTSDPDMDNNGAMISTARPSAIYVTPPQTGTAPVFVPVACANVVKGTRDDDVLRGTVFGDRLVGGDGADLLKGDAGDDCLEGGSGNDVLDGGNGDDRLAGDSGNDRLTGGNGNDRLTGGHGNDRLSGGNGNDVISPGAGKDIISGGPGNDTVNSVDGVRETVDCGSGRDTVRADKRDHLIHCERITRKR